MKNEYRFVTHWQLKAPVEKVWEAIYESENWPAWWKGVEAVSVLEKENETGLYGVSRYTWKSVLPYRLSFIMQLTERLEYDYLKGKAYGELEGEGAWAFSETNSITTVTYYWNVKTNKPWMNALSFLLKPLFKYNHDVVMRWGAEGLAKLLQAELVSC